jgi:hypothetical protein
MQTSGGHGQAFPRRIHSSVWWARTSCPPLVCTKDSGKEQRQKQLGDAFEWNKPYWSRLVGTDKMTPQQEQVIEESTMYTGEWSLRD